MKKITIVIPSGPGYEILGKKSIEEQGKDVVYVVQEGRHPSVNRNLGAQKAKTPFIAFINSHTILPPNWSSEVLSFFKNFPQIDVVGGPQMKYKSKRVFERASNHAVSSLFGSAIVRPRYLATKLDLHATEMMITSANLICRKEVLEKIKFDESIYPGEDPKFISDAIRAGFSVAYSPKIAVFNIRRSTFGSLFKQVFNYGRVRPLKGSLRETFTNFLFFVPSAFVGYLLLLPALVWISNLFWIPLAAYSLLNIGFSFHEAVKNRELASFFFLPAIFLTIHVAYGLGFIRGLLKKLIGL